MKQLKYSRQRESIKACLMARHDHPTADAIYASIREEFPNISLGTVYRNLNLLVELGEIRKLRCGDGADHFDAGHEGPIIILCAGNAAVSRTSHGDFPGSQRAGPAVCKGQGGDSHHLFLRSVRELLKAKTS